MNRAEAKNVLHTVGVPVSVFCRRIGISDAAFYRWVNHDLDLKPENEQKINEYIAKLKRAID